MPRIRPWLLSLPEKMQILVIVGATVASAFGAAICTKGLFDPHELIANSGLTASVYEVLGTTYAVLLAFAVSGVWQNFSTAHASVQAEADALSDLVHVALVFPSERTGEVRAVALAYAKSVVHEEWPALPRVAQGHIPPQKLGRQSSMALIRAVQTLDPVNAREAAVFEQTLVVLKNWLDARRERLESARGGSASALWPLLIAGAVVLFAFNGLFVTGAPPVWTALLLGFSSVVGLAFYLIFSLESPFTGGLSAKATPFHWVIEWIEEEMSPHPTPSATEIQEEKTINH